VRHTPLPLRIFPSLALLVAACAAPRASAPGDPEDPERRHLGAFYDREEKGETRTTQVRPFYWREDGPRGRTKVDVFGFLYRYRKDEAFTRVQIFPNVFYTARHTPQDRRTWWFMFFPILWFGHNDFLIFPIGGYSKGILGIDDFLMVSPLYIRTKAISSHPTDPVTFTTHYILWPFIAFGSDQRPGGRRKFRIAPFYGRSTGPGDAESLFVMWPFYTYKRVGKTRGWFSFPFYGRTVSPTRTETTIMWPIYHRNVDLLTGATDTAVWPFWRRAKGGDRVDIRRYWPFYEYRRVEFSTVSYVLWPVFRSRYVSNRDQFSRLTWAAPFYRHVRRFYREDGTELRKTIVWPVGLWERTRDGGREVFLPKLFPVDGPSLRQFAAPIRPFISLYHKRVAPNGDRDFSAAFGLVQSRRTQTTKKVRLLWGIVGWDRGPSGRYLRLFWGIRLRLSRKP
jgi:hypothetical protein